MRSIHNPIMQCPELSDGFILFAYSPCRIKIALVVVEISSYTDKLLTEGRTDRYGAYREITLSRSCNVFKFNPSKTNHSVPNACKKKMVKSNGNTYCNSQLNHYLFSAQRKIQNLYIYPRNPSI